jgi:hypothetical protein
MKDMKTDLQKREAFPSCGSCLSCLKISLSSNLVNPVNPVQNFSRKIAVAEPWFL